MIYPVQAVACKCDGCGAEYMDDHSGFSWYNDDQLVREATANSGWHNEGDKDYCPICHHFDDDDNLILTPKELSI